jgi:hypothetical protein
VLQLLLLKFTGLSGSCMTVTKQKVATISISKLEINFFIIFFQFFLHACPFQIFFNLVLEEKLGAHNCSFFCVVFLAVALDNTFECAASPPLFYSRGGARQLILMPLKRLVLCCIETYCYSVIVPHCFTDTDPRRTSAGFRPPLKGMIFHHRKSSNCAIRQPNQGFPLALAILMVVLMSTVCVSFN